MKIAQAVIQRFIAIWCASVCLGLLALAGLNYYLDPLFMFHYDNITQNVAKFEREHKPWQVRHVQPELLVVGNSRTDYSFDASRFGVEPAYNISVPGTGMVEIAKMFTHGLYVAKPKQLVVVLEYPCSWSYQSNMKHFSGNIFLEIRSHLELAKYLLAFDTLKKGIDVILEQPPVLYDAYGRRLTFTINEENSGSVLQRVLGREQIYINNAKTIPDNNYCSTSDLKNIIRQAYDHNVALSFLINPIHMRYLAIDVLYGNADHKLDKDKRLLVETVEQLARDYQQPAFPIYDFRMVNDITSEPLDLANNVEPTYWWETSHYKKNVGDKMIDWIKQPPEQRDLSFGLQLNSANMAAHAKRQIALHQAWQDHNPQTVAEIKNVIAEKEAKKSETQRP